MEYIYTFIHIVELLLYLFLGLTALYLLIFAVLGFLPAKKYIADSQTHRKIAVLIPGYKEDAVIIDVAKDALLQNYDRKYFDVVVIADSFEESTLHKLKELPIKLIEVSFDVSTKAKALNKAMALIGDDYDIALVLDADNLMEKDFLSKINAGFDKGYKIIQGHRIAKNINNSFAILDAISEEINNYIFRKAHRSVGLSAALIGSGMAFDYPLFKSTMQKMKAVGGFDKELEMYFLKNRYTIEYLENAIVKDEKVQKSEVFANQRRRWLSAQFIYFGENIASAFVQLFTKGNIDYFDKVIQMGQLPRVLLLAVTGLITVFYAVIFFFFHEMHLLLDVYQWAFVLLMIILALLLSVPRNFYNRSTLYALLTLPKGIFIMMLSMLRFKGANKKFIHTQHGKVS